MLDIYYRTATLTQIAHGILVPPSKKRLLLHRLFIYFATAPNIDFPNVYPITYFIFKLFNVV